MDKQEQKLDLLFRQQSILQKEIQILQSDLRKSLRHDQAKAALTTKPDRAVKTIIRLPSDQR
ncbi:hypothetical protein D3C87_2053260 [compost metagenome]